MIDELSYSDLNWYRGIETSPFMRSQAKQLFHHYAPEFKNEFYDYVPKDIEPGQVLLMGNVINELPITETYKLIDKLDPKVMIILDIGTKEVFKTLLELRDRMTSMGYSIEYPCRMEKSCPMKDSENWCHQKIFVTQDQKWERLGQKLKNDRRTLPFNSFVFVKNTKIESSQKIRLIRLFPQSKFGVSFEGCDDKGEIHQYEILKKTLSTHQWKKIKKMNWGELIYYESFEEKGNKRRLKLLSDFGHEDD